MKKETAIELLGGTPAKAAQAMGYKVVQTIYMWPDILPQSIADQVVGASSRLAKDSKPKRPNQGIATTEEKVA